jgi:hypothetical protein
VPVRKPFFEMIKYDEAESKNLKWPPNELKFMTLRTDLWYLEHDFKDTDSNDPAT